MARACKSIILAFVLPLSIDAASHLAQVSVGAAARQAQMKKETEKVHQVPLASILGEADLSVPKANQRKESVVALKALKTQKSNKAASVIVSAAPAPASASGPSPAPAAFSAPGDKDAKEKAPSVDSPAPASLDIDVNLPYGELAPFGRESTAIELTEDSINQSNKMVDEIEHAEVAEEKRAVFRALTRLRGAAITSFDGIARDQTSNIENYSKQNKWRKEHPVKHLADEEADVSHWAFPSNADMLL
eukprot:TRINITY_DN48898_c0_g1_i1.p1 TRINITY_DN48898_c0_g1~~TRINITY_DN48898_c0_g1_i1.p1  ORF type:complete len:247 (+),score=64.23 TRINITY_DN48898_c0_g1_i1:168-908(+)